MEHVANVETGYESVRKEGRTRKAQPKRRPPEERIDQLRHAAAYLHERDVAVTIRILWETVQELYGDPINLTSIYRIIRENPHLEQELNIQKVGGAKSIAERVKQCRDAAAYLREQDEQINVKNLWETVRDLYDDTIGFHTIRRTIRLHPELRKELNMRPGNNTPGRPSASSVSSQECLKQAEYRYRDALQVAVLRGYERRPESIAMVLGIPAWRVYSFFIEHPEVAKDMGIVMKHGRYGCRTNGTTRQ